MLRWVFFFSFYEMNPPNVVIGVCLYVGAVPLLCIACSQSIRSRSLAQASFTSRLAACRVYVS